MYCILQHQVGVYGLRGGSKHIFVGIYGKINVLINVSTDMLPNMLFPIFLYIYFFIFMFISKSVGLCIIYLDLSVFFGGFP